MRPATNYPDFIVSSPASRATARPMLRRWQWLLLGQLLLTVALVLLLGLSPPPFRTKLVCWDAMWYESIRAHGYFFRADAKSSAAFFPLFPMLWRLSGLGPVGISLLNLALAVGSGYLLRRWLRLRPAALLLFAALPSSLFLYLPYTEALFFLCTTLLLGLLARWPRQLGLLARWPRQLGLLALVLYVAALTRISALFYLPGLAMVETLGWLREPASWLPRLRRVLVYSLAVGAGLATVFAWQWWQTGVWLAFIKAQQQWQHYLQVPHLPFISTTDNDGTLWLDGLAMLLGAVALGWLAALAWRALRLGGRAPVADGLLVLAATFVAEAAVQVVAQAPVEGGHSSLMSLNRYVFCTPFFAVILSRLLPRQVVGWRTALPVLAAVLGLLATLGLFSGRPFDIEWPTSHLPLLWGPVAGWVYALAVLTYVGLWLRSGTRTGRAIVYGSSLALQLYYAYTYAVGHWVG